MASKKMGKDCVNAYAGCMLAMCVAVTVVYAAHLPDSCQRIHCDGPPIFGHVIHVVGADWVSIGYLDRDRVPREHKVLCSQMAVHTVQPCHGLAEGAKVGLYFQGCHGRGSSDKVDITPPILSNFDCQIMRIFVAVVLILLILMSAMMAFCYPRDPIGDAYAGWFEVSDDGRHPYYDRRK